MARRSDPGNLLKQAQEVETLLKSVSTGVLGARLRRARLRQGISIRDLAATAGVNKNSILHLEGGGAAQPLTVLKVCSALGLHVASIAGPDTQDADLAVHRKENDRWYDMEDLGAGPVSAENRAKLATPATMLLLQSRLETGQITPRVVELFGQTETRTHPGEEFVFVLDGKVCLTLGEEKILLESAEAIAFWSSEPHAYAPVGKSARILTVLVPHKRGDSELP